MKQRKFSEAGIDLHKRKSFTQILKCSSCDEREFKLFLV